MKFRFTLNNASAGSQVISEPVGWKNTRVKILRDVEYHCLVPMIDTQLSFYNRFYPIDGGRNYIINVENTQGPAAVISITIEVADTGDNYVTLFVGNLDLSTKRDVSRGANFYLYSCDIIPADNWAKFINRAETEVDLHATNDVNGLLVAQPSDIVLQMPSQAVRQFYTSTQEDGENTLYIDPNGSRYIPPMLDTQTVNELNVGDFPFDVSTEIPLPVILAQHGGTYTFDIRLSLTVIDCGFHSNNLLTAFFDKYYYPQFYALIEGIYYQINERTPVNPFSNTFQFGTASYAWGIYTWQGSLNLLEGDSVRFYIKTTNFGGGTDTRALGLLGNKTNIFKDANGLTFPSFGATNTSNILTYFRITADTVADSTTSDAMLIHDAANALVKRMGVPNGIYSAFLGGTSQGYSTDGCGSHFALAMGVHFRGYQFIEKLFSSSWKSFWDGMNPIFNLGCGIETVGGVSVIRIEQKDHWYNDTPILRFSNVEGITKSYDKGKVYKSIKIGYSTWSAESTTGIDDVQTSHTYSSPFSLFGTDLTIMSEWVAAALAIEQTRRNRREFNKDWKLDNNVMIVAINNDASPEVPEQNLFFTAITGLFNATSRYNIRLSVYRNFQRWISFLSGFMQPYLSTTFKFTGGEGNYSMAVGANSDTCDTGTWTENQNILPSASHYYEPDQYTFTYPLSFSDFINWLNNINQCIEVSTTSTGHVKMHCEEIDYDVFKGQVTVKGWIKIR